MQTNPKICHHLQLIGVVLLVGVPDSGAVQWAQKKSYTI